MWSNKFIRNPGIIGSVWELKVPLYVPYTMFPTCFRAHRFIRTGSGNILVSGIHKGIALAIEDASVDVTHYMHNKSDREWNENVGGICLGFMKFYWDFHERFYSWKIMKCSIFLIFYNRTRVYQGDEGIKSEVSCMVKEFGLERVDALRRSSTVVPIRSTQPWSGTGAEGLLPYFLTLWQRSRMSAGWWRLDRKVASEFRMCWCCSYWSQRRWSLPHYCPSCLQHSGPGG